MNSEVTDYVRGLDYDKRVILAEHLEDESIPSKPLNDAIKDDGSAMIIGKRVKNTLNGTFDDQFILSPNVDTIVWPGALVKADQNLVNGSPIPIKAHRAPVRLSIDLPGLGEKSKILVDDPSLDSVNAERQKVLAWWNENSRIAHGYVNPARSDFRSTIAHNSQQVAASLGINYKGVGIKANAEMNFSSDSQKKVAVALYKQVFYTVRAVAPPEQGEWFRQGTSLNDIKHEFGNEIPPAYVSSVDYGRLIMLRIETTQDITEADFKGAINGYGLEVDASGSLNLDNSKTTFTLITIGGNAEISSKAVRATSVSDLHQIITGANSLYSPGNPGVPISYNVRFLKDDALAKIGFQTEYTHVTYTRHAHGWIGFRHSGAYIAKFLVTWQEGDQPAKSWKSGDKTAGFTKKVDLKGTAKNIHVVAEAATGLVWDPWGEIFNERLPAPPNQYFVVKGTTLHRSYEKE